jgi:hypothetical protein
MIIFKMNDGIGLNYKIKYCYLTSTIHDVVMFKISFNVICVQKDVEYFKTMYVNIDNQL